MIDQVDRIEAHGAGYDIVNPGGLIGRPIAEGRPYEQKLLEMIYGEGFTGVALDIGAHVGNHTLWLAAICGLEVHAFEPLHTARLRANVDLNPDLSIVVHAVALGAESGAFARVVGKDRLLVGDGGGIPVIRLDDLALDDVSVIKIDVEDLEPDVLRGAEATIGRNRPVIYAETRDAHAEANVAEVLEPWGYRLTVLVPVATPVTRWEHQR